MRVMGLDFEATGLDTSTARIVEVGLAIWDTEENKPLLTQGYFLYDPTMESHFTVEAVAMMKDICNISVDEIREFGADPRAGLLNILKLCDQYEIQYIVAHNGTNYDRPLLNEELKRQGIIDCPVEWIDTRTDLPYESEPDSRKLKYMAADNGFLNPFPHRALFDVLTMLKVFSGFSIESILEYRAIPWVVIRAMVSYDDRQLAKDAKFSWEKVGDQTFSKCWVKRVKQSQVDVERAKVSFQIAEIG